MPPRKIANIPDRTNSQQPMFVTWNDEKGKHAALMSATQASQQYGAIAERSKAYGSDIFMNAGPLTSVRDGLNRRDWEFFRPEEAVPKNIRNILVACGLAYKRIGIIHNIIDMMAEFTCQGIRLVHPNPGIQELHQQWAKKICFKERSERFCNYLYRMANVIVQRESALLKPSDLDNLRRGLAQEEIQPIDPPPKVRKGEIPWSYTFINPLSLDVLGGEEFAQFAGVAVYGLTIPERVYNKIRTPKTNEEKYIVSQLPTYIVNSVRNGVKIIRLDPDKVQTFFYKKDDWQIWAEPITYGVIDDLILFNKMRLADLSALDGAISRIRLWKLGDLANRILPTPAGIARLAEILINNTAVGAVDLIWGPELTLEETSTDVHQFLGSAKYEQVIENIHNGLGVPYSSRGGDGKGGMASYLSLKVMIERLKYGRDRLNEFWEPELVRFQKALGLRQPAELQYDYMVLTDENAFLRLLIELIDRDIIAAETVQEAFGRIPEIEQAVIRKEHRKRKSGKMKRKAGPFHSPNVEDDLLKMFVQSGIVTPGQAGVELGDKLAGEKTLMDYKLQQTKQAAQLKQLGGQGNPNGNPQAVKKPKGKSGQGRPPGKRDTMPRKQKPLRPVKASNFFTVRAWARQVQNSIAEVVNPVFCASYGKDMVRKLTDEEVKNLEEFKFALLCNLEPFSEFTEDTLHEMIDNPLPIDPIVTQLLTATLAKFQEKFSRTPIVDEVRLFQAEAYALFAESESEDGVDFIDEDEDEVTFYGDFSDDALLDKGNDDGEDND